MHLASLDPATTADTAPTTKSSVPLLLFQRRLKECSFRGCRIVIRSEYNTNYLESCIDASWVKIRCKLVEMEDATSTSTTRGCLPPSETQQEYVARVHPDLAYSTLALPHAAGLNLLLPPLAQVKRYVDSQPDVVVRLTQKQRDAQLIKRLTKADPSCFLDRDFCHSDCPQSVADS
jgi:hypothetical protein